MAVLSTLVKAVAEAEGLDETHVGWVARYLREAGFIKSGGRGRGGALMTAEDATNLLIGTNGATSPKSAVEAVRSFRAMEIKDNLSLISSKNGPLQDIFADDAIFGSAMDQIIDIAARSGPSNDILGAALVDSLSFPQGGEGRQDLIDDVDKYLTFNIKFTRPILRVDLFALVGREIYGHVYFSGADEEYYGDRIETTQITQRTLRTVGSALYD